MDAVRFAFIGCGTIAPFHLRALEECTHSTEVTAAVDVRRDRAEKFSSLLQSPCQVGGANYDVDLAGYPRSQAVGNEARRVGWEDVTHYAIPICSNFYQLCQHNPPNPIGEHKFH